MKHDAVSQAMFDALKMGNGSVEDIMEVRLDVEPIVARLGALRPSRGCPRPRGTNTWLGT